MTYVDLHPRLPLPDFVRGKGDVMLSTRAVLAPFDVANADGSWLLRRRALWLPLPGSIPLVDWDPRNPEYRVIGTFDRIEIDEEQDALVAFGSALAGALEWHLDKGEGKRAGIYPIFGLVGPPLGRFPYIADEGGDRAVRRVHRAGPVARALPDRGREVDGLNSLSNLPDGILLNN